MTGNLKPQKVFEMLYEKTKGEAIVVTDVGQHQMWAAQYYRFNKADKWVTSGGLGTMGFGLPASIGAQLAAPDSNSCFNFWRWWIPNVSSRASSVLVNINYQLKLLLLTIVHLEWLDNGKNFSMMNVILKV